MVTREGPRRIDSLIVPTHVLSWDAKLGRYRFVLASASFLKGRDYLYRVLTRRGEWRGAANHLVFCDDGTYQSVESLRPGQFVAQCSFDHDGTNFAARERSLIDVRSLSRIIVGLKGRCELLFRRYDQQLLSVGVFDQVFSPLQFYAQECDAALFGVERSRLSQPSDPPPTRDYLPQVGGLLGDLAGALQGLAERIGSYTLIAQLSSLIEGVIASISDLLGGPYEYSMSNGAIIQISRCAEQEDYWDLQVPGTNNYVTVDGGVHHNSGKSVACCMKALHLALQQPPGLDGIARSRIIIVRNTFPELKSTTIQTWLDWFPENVFGKVKWDSPILHKLDLGPDRILEAYFLALDNPEDIKKLLSFDTNWIWLNEVRQLPKAILDAATGRLGRYPPPKYGVGAFNPCLFMDTNSMDDDHWYYRLAEGDPIEGFSFFNQPGGLDPGAENLNWLTQSAETLKLPIDHPDRLAAGRRYYERIVAGKDESWVKVFVNNEYASVSEDRAVFPNFNERIHVAPAPLKPIPGVELRLGFDFGLTPACLIGQLSPRGQLRILDEITSEDMGLQRFLEEKVKPFLELRYSGFTYRSPHDPAGAQRSQANEVTCRKILRTQGMNPMVACTTNDMEARVNAVSYFLTRMVDGDPAFLVSPTCKMFRKGMAGAYKWERVQVKGEERYKDSPTKNMYSHICEAGQYLCLSYHKPASKEPRITVPERRHTPYVAATAAGY